MLREKDREKLWLAVRLAVPPPLRVIEGDEEAVPFLSNESMPPEALGLLETL